MREHRIARALGARAVLVGAHRCKWRRQPLEPEDLAREVVPRGLTGAAHVAEPRVPRPDHAPDRARHVERVGRPEHLVGHHAERPALAGQPEHRLHEVRSALARALGDAEEARDANHQRPLAALVREALAPELGHAVGTDRIRRVGLRVGEALRAVEDVVCRELHERRAERLAGIGQRAHRLGVQRECAARLVLRRIHGVPRRGVDHVRRPQRAQPLARPPRVEEIQLRPPRREQRAGQIERPREIEPKLARRADQHVAGIGTAHAPSVWCVRAPVAQLDRASDF